MYNEVELVRVFCHPLTKTQKSRYSPLIKYLLLVLLRWLDPRKKISWNLHTWMGGDEQNEEIWQSTLLATVIVGLAEWEPHMSHSMSVSGTLILEQSGRRANCIRCIRALHMGGIQHCLAHLYPLMGFWQWQQEAETEVKLRRQCRLWWQGAAAKGVISRSLGKHMYRLAALYMDSELGIKTVTHKKPSTGKEVQSFHYRWWAICSQTNDYQLPS